MEAMGVPTTIQAAKAALRKDMKAILRSLSPESKAEQSKIVTQRVLNHAHYVHARNLAIYLSMNDEINTQSLLKDALSSGKKCFVPRYFADGRAMDMVELMDLDDYDRLPLTRWNIKQPHEQDTHRLDALKSGLDLILVPGLAFTASGQRLGRGKGYYDTYLQKCRSILSPGPRTLALAFQEQIVDHIPTHDHDQSLDAVIAPNL